MRQWLVDPKVLCRKHLLGEHVELHMFAGSINKGVSMKGFLSMGLLEPLSMPFRHAELVEEMLRRGYTHKSPLQGVQWAANDPSLMVTISREWSLAVLIERCEDCAVRYSQLLYSKLTKDESFFKAEEHLECNQQSSL